MTTSDLRVRVQLLDHDDWARWPDETVRVETRYSEDLPTPEWCLELVQGAYGEVLGW